GLEDAAGVGVLQTEADLDAEEADAHVPDRPHRQARPRGARHLAFSGQDGGGVLHQRGFLPSGTKRMAWPPPGARFSVSVSAAVTSRGSMTRYSRVPR